MRIFALETNLEKLTRMFVPEEIEPVFVVRYHWLRFLIHALKSLISTAIVIALAVGIWWFGAPGLYVAGPAFLLWLFLVGFPLLTTWIDWRFDLLILTKDRIIVIRQSSIFHREIREMNLENIATVNTTTQLWNLFPFGQLCIDLKEGAEQQICLPYIPHADEVSKSIANVLVDFQKKRMNVSHP